MKTLLAYKSCSHFDAKKAVHNVDIVLRDDLSAIVEHFHNAVCCFGRVVLIAGTEKRSMFVNEITQLA